ncbi:MAG: MFS transporter [Muribaculaceae bacterium]|nr:MFS transporter [Muribaculaceae bacterium]MDE7465568.1 MFS transporter [Muribaculaceae bacterium]
MLIKGGKELTILRKNGKSVSAIYRGFKLVWEAVRSCFGSGVWRGEKPWVGKDGWKE